MLADVIEALKAEVSRPQAPSTLILPTALFRRMIQERMSVDGFHKASAERYGPMMGLLEMPDRILHVGTGLAIPPHDTADWESLQHAINMAASLEAGS